MKRQKTPNGKPTTGKTILLLFLLTIMFFSTSAVLTSYPQHIYISNSTKIDVAKFLDGNKLLLKGNMVQYGAGDTIPLEGREYIRITGNQAQIGGTTYKEGIRTVVASFTQNILFTQTLGNVKDDRPSQIIIDTSIINLIPVNDKIYNIDARVIGKKDINNYNVEFVQDTIYLNENGIMLKLTKKSGYITIGLVGIDVHKTIIVRTI